MTAYLDSVRFVGETTLADLTELKQQVRSLPWGASVLVDVMIREGKVELTVDVGPTRLARRYAID